MSEPTPEPDPRSFPVAINVTAEAVVTRADGTTDTDPED